MSSKTVAWYVEPTTPYTDQVIRHRENALNLDYCEAGIETNFGRVAPVWQCPYQLIEELRRGMTQMNPPLRWRVFEKLADGQIVERPDLGSAGERSRRKESLVRGAMRRTRDRPSSKRMPF